MKIFLSHPMNGKTDEEVMKIRQEAIDYLTAKYGKIEIVDNYHHNNAPEDAGRLWYLAESIKLLDGVDAVYLCPGWWEARGCWIELHICQVYGITVLD